MSRLTAFWRRLGAVPDREAEKVNQGAVLFLSPELALRVREDWQKDGLKNPYEMLSHSIYPPDLEKQLTANRGDARKFAAGSL